MAMAAQTLHPSTPQGNPDFLTGYNGPISEATWEKFRARSV